MKKNRFSFFIFLILFVAALGVKVFAQSATAETLEKGTYYAEANLWSGVQRQRNGGSQIYGGRLSYGWRRNVEVGVNFSISDPHDPDFPPELQPNAKWRFYQSEKYGVEAAGGAIAFLPIARRGGTDAFVMIYGNLSKTFRGAKSPTLTVGTYALLARQKNFGSRKGWNFQYDQPLTRKISFSTQWTTGNNRFGYVTPGFNVQIGKNGNLFLGYSIGNNDYDNHGPYLSYGIYR